MEDSSKEAILNFQAMLQSICRTPAMYVARRSLHRVCIYVDGYDHAVMDMTQCGSMNRPLYGWQWWIEARFLIRHPGWHWTRILLHIYRNDEAAIEVMPTLYDEFLMQREAMGVDGIEKEREQRLIAAYGEDVYAPAESHTKPMSASSL